MTTSETAPRPPRLMVAGMAPVTWALAGRPWFPLWAVVHHTGRRSGKAYSTPIAIVPARDRDTFLVGLPWGPRTNWAQNVLAAGGARVTWRGREVETTNPRLVETAEAARLARGPVRRVVGSGRFPAFLLLDRPAG